MVFLIGGFRTQEEDFSEDCSFRGFDLIIVDLPESLHVPNVSSPSHIIPAWNNYKIKNIEALFQFACAYLTHDVPLLLFVPEIKMLEGM